MPDKLPSSRRQNQTWSKSAYVLLNCLFLILKILSFVPTVFGRYIQKGPPTTEAPPAEFHFSPTTEREDDELAFLRVIQIRKEATEELRLKKERYEQQENFEN